MDLHRNYIYKLGKYVIMSVDYDDLAFLREDEYLLLSKFCDMDYKWEDSFNDVLVRICTELKVADDSLKYKGDILISGFAEDLSIRLSFVYKNYLMLLMNIKHRTVFVLFNMDSMQFCGYRSKYFGNRVSKDLAQFIFMYPEIGEL